jgi:hypothetical protein
MSKEQTILQLRDAKKAHIKWVQRAKALTEGLPIEKDAIPMESTECAFGQWFYGEGQKLGLLPGMECFKEIERQHNALHDIYLKIFKIYFGERHRSFFSKLFNIKRTITPAEHDIAVDYFTQLKEVSEVLLGQIEKLERRLNAMPESEIVNSL